MKCQNCGRHEVTFHYSSNINGVVTERHLCSGCARELGYSNKSFFSADDIFDSFFRNPFGIPSDIPGTIGFVTPVLFAAPPQMGILIQNSTAPDVLNIPTQDTDVDADMKKRREINILREQMDKAAQTEDFEKAIELREKIRKMSDGN